MLLSGTRCSPAARISATSIFTLLTIRSRRRNERSERASVSYRPTFRPHGEHRKERHGQAGEGRGERISKSVALKKGEGMCGRRCAIGE